MAIAHQALNSDYLKKFFSKGEFKYFIVIFYQIGKVFLLTSLINKKLSYTIFLFLLSDNYG